MKLGDFIESNMCVLLADWIEQARRLGLAPSASISQRSLEDSARQLLTSIAMDIRQPQSSAHRLAKARGLRPENAPEITRQAQEHADDRLAQGFSLNDVVAEYRALRASVIRHWLAVPELATTERLDLRPTRPRCGCRSIAAEPRSRHSASAGVQ